MLRTPILIVFCQLHENSVWYRIYLTDVLKFFPIGQNFIKNLISWSKVFLKNGFLQTIIDKCFKTVINKPVTKHRFISTVEKTLILSLPYLWDISLQTRPKLRKSFKGILNCCKLQIVFKIQKKLSCFPIQRSLAFRLTCGRCNCSYYGETDRHLKFRSAEHIEISPLTFRKAKPLKDHVLICNNIPSFDKFTILVSGHHKYILEIKESLLVKRNRSVLNKNISSAKLFNK